MMASFAHQVIAGLVTGAIYASLALALVMIYQATHHVNFAQGEMAMVSTYLAWTLIQAGIPYWIAFAGTVILSFALGLLVERIVVRPIARDSALSTVAVFIGLLIIMNSLAGWIWDYTLRQFPSPFGGLQGLSTSFVSAHELGSLGVTLVVLGLVFVFFRFTKLGLAMRAVAENPMSSRLVGIDVERMLALGWGLAAAIGAVAGMMVAPIIYLDPNMMSGTLIYAFAGALLGGIDSPVGAVVGGLVIGVLENLLGAYLIGTEFKLSVALLLIIGVLVIRPSGLFGKTVVVRV